MAKMYYQQDCDLNYLNGKKIAIIGYGSQGHAHALNLKDSGCDVCVGLRAGSKSWAAAEQAGLAVKTVADAAKWADVVMMLVNDEVQADAHVAAGILQVQGVGVALGAVADDGDLLAQQAAQVAVLLIIHLSHSDLLL